MNKFEFDVTGVTGAARDGSQIQEALKAFFEDALESGSYSSDHAVKFEEYDAEGAKALAVIVDDKEIGSIKDDDAAEVSALIGKNNDCVVSFGINGHDIDEYEKIIDRYKDKKFWKEEDPNFNDAEVNKAYNDLMKGLKEGKEYQATVKFPVAAEANKAAEETAGMTEEEKKRQADMEAFMRYFKILFPLSIVVLVIGIFYVVGYITHSRAGSLMVGVINIMFGSLGAYFSWKYSKPGRKVGRKRNNKDANPSN